MHKLDLRRDIKPSECFCAEMGEGHSAAAEDEDGNVEETSPPEGGGSGSEGDWHCRLRHCGTLRRSGGPRGSLRRHRYSAILNGTGLSGEATSAVLDLLPESWREAAARGRRSGDSGG